MGGKVVHWVRHGEATHNPRAEALRAAGCTFDEFLEAMKRDDELDAPLTPRGQAQAAAAHTPARPPAVFVSPLSRAIDTALAIFPGARLIALDDLRERSGWLLNARRRRVAELVEKFPACDFGELRTEEDELWTEELESWESCGARGRAALQFVWERPEEEVAVVAHGGLFDAIFNRCSDIVAESELKPRFSNAEIRSTWVEQKEGVFHLRKLSGGREAAP
ncbi:hypothetical protein AB1Y20_016677 [Prymnesium parvum]|uniref:Histidine phosphatase family protein n=1 Tax=Prymnesium parvum TaxID=97485 RepID=A0AB34IBE4_PRYPA